MSVLQRVTGWLTGKNNHNAQTAYGGYKPRGYYGSAAGGGRIRHHGLRPRLRCARRGLLSENQTRPPDHLGGGDPYNGRVPYRSQRDQYAEQESMRYQQADMRHRRIDAQQPPYQQTPYARQDAYQQPQEGNIVNFPERQQETAPAHVEYVILLRSRNECTKVIEYIKTNASVFLNMEYIANEGERQRCVDMLSGAAYTLGCQLHKNLKPRYLPDLLALCARDDRSRDEAVRVRLRGGAAAVYAPADGRIPARIHGPTRAPAVFGRAGVYRTDERAGGRRHRAVSAAAGGSIPVPAAAAVFPVPAARGAVSPGSRFAIRQPLRRALLAILLNYREVPNAH